MMIFLKLKDEYFLLMLDFLLILDFYLIKIGYRIHFLLQKKLEPNFNFDFDLNFEMNFSTFRKRYEKAVIFEVNYHFFTLQSNIHLILHLNYSINYSIDLQY
jgi:hypothetical protein